MEQKLHKKRLKYESILKKDMDIESSRRPTTVSFFLFNVQYKCNIYLFNMILIIVKTLQILQFYFRILWYVTTVW